MSNSRAIGIVRVSQREDDSGHSPQVQVRAMLKLAPGEGLTLDPKDILDENIDGNGKIRKVSGGWSLEDRPKFLWAVEQVETGKAKAIIAERADRFFRDLDVQREVIRRVEAAGGRLVTLKGGALSHATAEDELQANINGAIGQYNRRTAKERSWDAVEVAIEEGKIPWSQTAPGYLRSDDSKLTPDPKLAPIVAEAFEMRAKGATVDAVRKYLRKHGIRRSYHGTTHLLRDRVYVGQIHFGDHTPNLTAHTPIVERRTFNLVQRIRVPRGRKPKSDRILARLGILRCANCGARMVVGTANNSAYWIYRCPPTADCTRRVTISADLVETVVIDAVKAAITDAEGRASAEENVRHAVQALEHAQADLDAAFRVFAGFEDEAAARERLAELRLARDEAQERVDRLGGSRPAVTVSAVDDWERLSLEARRALIRAVVEQVSVTRGRGADRITIKLVGE